MKIPNCSDSGETLKECMMGERKSGVRQKPQRVAGLILSLSLVGLLSTGCYSVSNLISGYGTVPYVTSLKVRGQAVNDKSKIIPGKTTKNEILTSFGAPAHIRVNENVWLYFWKQSHSGWRTWNNTDKSPEPFSFFSGPQVEPGEDNKKRVWTKKMCFLLFNQNDVLKNYKIQELRRADNIDVKLEEWLVYEKTIIYEAD